LKALIDADILVYRIGFTTENEDIEIAKWRMNDLIQKILADTQATSYTCYLTASNDDTAFRRKVYPEYKLNRKAPKPVHYKALREFLIEEYEAVLCSCIEADDALGIAQTAIAKANGKSIIVSIDKDLDCVPGLHYNFVKENLYCVTNWQAAYNFYRQCLTGDTADNVKGIAGIGPKKAEKILEGAVEEEELFQKVREAYSNDYEFLINAEVLWICHQPFPQGRWSLSSLGSQLGQEVISQLGSDSSPVTLSTESIIAEELTDGFPVNGDSLKGTTDLIAGSQI
jgi:5'-3' exonuclease